MSRFDSNAYDKLFPRSEEVESVESVVETFTPTTDKIEGKEVVDVNVDIIEEGEVVDGNS